MQFLQARFVQLGMGAGMGAERDALACEFADFLPFKVLLAAQPRPTIADEVCGKEDCGGEAVLPENREGVSVEIPVAVVEGQHDAKRRCWQLSGCRVSGVACLLGINKLHCFGKANDMIIVVLEVSHMFGEPGRGGVDPEIRVALFFFIANAVIHQDRNPESAEPLLPCQRSEQVKCNESI